MHMCVRMCAHVRVRLRASWGYIIMSQLLFIYLYMEILYIPRVPARLKPDSVLVFCCYHMAKFQQKRQLQIFRALPNLSQAIFIG